MVICATGTKIGAGASARKRNGAGRTATGETAKAVAASCLATTTAARETSVLITAAAETGSALRAISVATPTTIISAGATGTWRRSTATTPIIAESGRRSSIATSTAGVANGAAIRSRCAQG